jgi:hypothetical protein
LFSLKQKSLWFSCADSFNDPYENKAMILDREELNKSGFPNEVLDICEGLFDGEDLEMVCLSALDYSSLPMWAYYANNSQGFCVEYSVENKSAIHEVIYEPEIIKIAGFLTTAWQLAKKAMKGDEEANIAIYPYLKIFMQSPYIKNITWKHEKEYRIVQPKVKKIGENIRTENIGLRTSKIIAGVNCSKKNIRKLNNISETIGCRNIYCATVNKEKFGMNIMRYIQ